MEANRNLLTNDIKQAVIFESRTYGVDRYLKDDKIHLNKGGASKVTRRVSDVIFKIVRAVGWHSHSKRIVSKRT